MRGPELSQKHLSVFYIKSLPATFYNYILFLILGSFEYNESTHSFSSDFSPLFL